MEEITEIIKELKTAKKAYVIALEYDYCPHQGDPGYEDGIDHYSGCRPDEIIGSISRLIDKL
jgi:hypothetical protein